MNKGSVWWVDFEPATGSEIKKLRPAIIVSNNKSNELLDRVVVIPFTSKIDKVYPSEAIVNIGNKWSKAMADQIRTVDKSRLKNKICNLSLLDIQKVNTIIRVHLSL